MQTNFPLSTNRKIPVSVIIPCYRCGDTIDAALSSALSQTWSATEIWLIDDCSNDATLEYLKQLQNKFPEWVRVLSLPQNGGPGPARNAGWEAATQPWLAFLDADDVWHPKKLETQWQWLQQNPDAMLCGHQTRLLRDGDLQADVAAFESIEVSLADMLRSNQFPTRTVMIQRSVPFRFEGKDYSEDYLLWLQVITAAMPAYKLSVCLAYSLRPEYSQGGVSGNLWRLERGELRSLWRLFVQRKLSAAQWGLAACWSITKFARRLVARLVSH